jgi:hypothetical protein
VIVNTYVTDETPVHLRFDQGTASEEYWSTSSDKTALFAPDAAVFVEGLLGRSRLVFRFQPYNENPQTTIFVIPSLSPHRAMVLKHCGFDPTARLAQMRAQRARLAIESKKLARQQRADSLAQVVSIELVPPEGTIEISHSDSVLAKSIVKRVTNRKGEVLTTYQLEFEISYPDEGRSLTFSGDVLPLELGANEVTVIVNGVPAIRELRYVVH